MGYDLDRVFLTLINRSIAATWLVAAVLVLRFILRRAPKWTRCLLWALVAVRLVFSLSIPSSWSAFNLVNTPVNEFGEIEYAEYMGEGVNPSVVFERPALSVSSDKESDLPVTVETEREYVYLPFLSQLWLTGVGAMLLYALISYLKLRRRVAASIKKDGIWLCDDIESPFILGVLAPRIYVPSGLCEPQLSHVLAHERAHLARHDHWWKPLGFALLTVYWFTPALWLAYILLCRDIELACDERVYRDMAIAERADYSQTLLDQSRSGSGVAACPLAFGEVGVKERVRAALSYKKPAFWVIAVAVVACTAAAACLLTNPASLPIDFAAEDIENVKAYHAETAEDVGVRQLDDRSGELCEWLSDLKGFQRGSYKGMTPLYALTLSVAGRGDLQIRGYNDNGLMNEISYCGKTWRIKDDEFGRYVMELCKYGWGQSEDPGVAAWDAEGGDRLRASQENPCLTLDDVRALAKKGAALSARDFNGYAYYETGSGLYIKAYPIDEVFAVLLGFASPDADEPMYFKLTAKNDHGVFGDNVDMDSGDVESYIAMHSADKNGQEKPRLTLDDVRALAKKGAALTWEDLEGYEYYVAGSGLHSHLYPIDGRFSLTASGTLSSLRSAELHDDAAAESVDIRDPVDLNAFLDSHEKAQSVLFTNILGFAGHYIDLEIAPGFYQRRYIIRTGNNERGLIAESFGFTIDDHIADLDGDDAAELVCNCVSGGDGAQRVYVYRRHGGFFERGSIDYDKLNLTDWYNWGVNSTAEWYDLASGNIIVEYASLASSSGDGTVPGTFICETGYDAFSWEELARLPD